MKLTTITITHDSIEVSSHSDHAAIGQDIVFASISTAAIFIQRLIKADYVQREGYMLIKNEFTQNGWLFDTYKELMQDLQEQYPDNIIVFDLRGNILIKRR